MNRAAHLFARAGENGDKIALIFGEERIDYATLAARVSRAAAELQSLGVRQHARVGVMMPNSPDFIIIQQGLFFLGAVFSPLNVYYQASEIAHTVSSCELEFLILPPELFERTLLLRQSAGPKLLIVSENGLIAPHGQTRLPVDIDDPDLAVVAPDDVAMLLHTSATTGKSKGVMLTAANLAANYDRTPGWLGLERDCVILCALPLYNTFGLNQGINALLFLGATMVLLPRFDAHRCADAIERYRCTFLPAVPTMLQRLFDDAQAQPRNFKSLTCIMTGGAPVPAALLRRVERVTGPETVLLTGYGLTEATALVTLTRVELDDYGDVLRGRTIGRVLCGMDLAILDANGGIARDGEIGEIAVRGPNVMAGYYEAPEDTAMALRAGWLHTGDLGIRDSDGFVTIVDRLKDVIIRGGQNIYPADIEEVLYSNDAVAEAAVVCREDEALGEVPVAFVAPKIGHRIVVSDLLDRCRANLAPFKIPVEFNVLPELPKGPTGKILRRELRGSLEAAA